jgi:hypothetical protein
MINQLVNDPQIQHNVARLQLLSHLRGSGGERGADIIERAAIVGVNHLIPYKERAVTVLDKIVAHNIDVFAVAAVVAYCVFLVLKTIIGLVFGNRRKAKHE